MNKEKMLESLGDIDPELVREAEPKARRPRYIRYIGCAAAALVVVIGAAFVIPKLIRGSQNPPEINANADPGSATYGGMPDSENNGLSPAVTSEPIPTDTALPVQTEPNPNYSCSVDSDWMPELPNCLTNGGNLLASPPDTEYAVYPLVAPGGNWDEYERLEREWNAALSERRAVGETAASTGSFAGKLFRELLEANPNENVVFSPASVYVSLGMLAEVSDGETRAQILAALDMPNMGALRKGVSDLLKAESNDDGQSVSETANSIWVKKGVRFNTDTLNALAGIYGTSAYWGDPEDKAFEKAFRDWINESTGGMFEGSLESVALDPSLIFSVVSTIHFKAEWEDGLSPNYLHRVFYTPNGTIFCDYTAGKCDKFGEVYLEFEGFTMARKTLKDEVGYVWFILPDKEKTFDAVDLNAALAAMKADYSEEELWTITYLVPVYDISSDLKLIPALEKLGIEDCFTPGKADLSSLLDEADGIYVDRFDHSARLAVTHKGVEGAAYAHWGATYGANEKHRAATIYLDRPFITVVTGVSGEPLFMSAVYDPTK